MVAGGGQERTQEINLRIGEVRMSLEIPRSQVVEQRLRRAADQVNTTLERYRLSFKGVTKVELLSYVALDIANQLQTQKLEREELQLDERLTKLTNELDDVL